ncbi:MAG: endo alpha-1,4 polygalactosaminidase [Succinivibrio sp.]
MKRLAFLFVLTVFGMFFCAHAKTVGSICFYYNEVDSIRELIDYDRVVLEPKNITKKQLNHLKQSGTKVYAYLSVGEYDSEVPDNLKSAVKSHNDAWNSAVMDVSSDKWKKHLLEKAQSLRKAGFDGLFLDTLDSFNLYADSDEDSAFYKEQVKGLASIVNDIHKKSPSLILNRGFEIFDLLSFKPEALAFESLYRGYNPSDNSYTAVDEKDRKWLVNTVEPIKRKGVEIIAIDYLSDKSQDERIKLAKKIASHGYTPYVSDGHLNGFGTSFIYPVPKRVLTFYDSRYSSQLMSASHNRIATPLEYLGYAVDTVDVNNINYDLIDRTRYAAIIPYLENAGSYADNPQFEEFIREHIGYIPVLFLGNLPNSTEVRKALGFEIGPKMDAPYSVQVSHEVENGKLKPRFSSLDSMFMLKADRNICTDVYVSLKDAKGRESPLVFKTSWGGAALYPYPVDTLDNNEDYWFVEPFAMLDKILNLKAIPAADVTTESGLRILTSHVDGDGFPSRSWFKGSPLVSEVLYNEVFKAIEVPHTVSVIQGEVAADGMYKEQSEELEKIARKIFELPNVEIASHTFSHPFDWDLDRNQKKLIYGEHLPIPGYQLDYDREMKGSIDYINQKLAPKGKRVEVFLWSGNANPTGKLVDLIDSYGILNLNGGNTTIKRGEESLTNVSPTVCWYKDAVQVYAPAMNENVYTNEWTEHFDGFSRAKETYELTGTPRRLKTISIYYHMYSGTYEASLNALKSLYEWALTQDVTPLYISDYAKRARTLYETGLSRTLDGVWSITSTGVRSIRIPHSMGYPVSDCIAGFNTAEDGSYLILKQNRNRLTFAGSHQVRTELKSANGMIEKWVKNGSHIDFTVRSYVPLKMEMWSKNRCQMVSSTEFEHQRDGFVDTFTTQGRGLVSGTLICN